MNPSKDWFCHIDTTKPRSRGDEPFKVFKPGHVKLKTPLTRG